MTVLPACEVAGVDIPRFATTPASPSRQLPNALDLVEEEVNALAECCDKTFLQRAGLELMDMMAIYQDGAYERLCRFQSCWAEKQLSVTHFGSSRMLHIILSSSRALSSSPGYSSLTFGNEPSGTEAKDKERVVCTLYTGKRCKCESWYCGPKPHKPYQFIRHRQLYLSRNPREFQRMTQ
ncbi:hypothetical protein Syun_010095 [Stephania yunnanensis]|uniref:Uncharacterized protein n=1 Tax=Stephania yunnanensis TaxID=152371 RepID=A0AAP0KFT8_9MAGN